MNADDPELLEDELTSLLAEMDDALAAGVPLPVPAVSAEIAERLDRGLDCLRRLQELRDRSDPPRGEPGLGVRTETPRKHGRRWWWHREPKVARLLALFLLAVAVGFAGVAYQCRRACLERDLARRDRARVEANFQKARAVVDRVSRVAEDFWNRPHLDRTRHLVLADVSSFYRDLLAQNRDDASVQFEAASACERLAEVRNWLGQWDDEAHAVAVGLELVDRLLRASPSDPRYRYLRHRLLVRWARHLMAVGHSRMAEDAYVDAIAICETLVAGDARNSGYRSCLANCLMNLATLRKGRHAEEARRDCRRAVALQRECVWESPRNRSFRRELALGLDDLAHLALADGDRGEAERLAREALAIRRELVKDEPELSRDREFLARSEASLAWMLRTWGRRDEAEALARQAIATTDALVADFPDAPDPRLLRGNSRAELALVLSAAHRYGEAEPALKSAIRTLEGFAADFPSSASKVGPRLGACRLDLAVLLANQGRRAEVRPLVEKALDAAPDNPAVQNEMAWVLANDPDVASRDPARAVELAGKAVKSRPRDGNYRNTLGVAHYRAGALGEARKALEKAMELRRDADPCDWLFMSMVCRDSGEAEAAARWYERAARAIGDMQPPDPQLLRFQAEAKLAVAGRR